ncbi:hypothetical protein BaOVIS_025870 [Babesia ovis]|uniref:Uncharacterized protein n=1 Tax=Babesia ovis TaxID=5869 RepID=A0A9W5WVP8_BABOV|nr:hypothetical protein BaOVIS_025870 [Babesia ovis]
MYIASISQLGWTIELREALDSSLDEDGRNSIDAEVAAAIVELQQEACDAVMFLEGVAQLAESSHAFINGDPEHRNSLVVQQNSLRNHLIARQKELDATLLDNASNLDHLDTNIAAALARIRQLRTASKSSNHNTGHSSAYVDDETAHQRSIEATRLLSAMETSPLKVIEEGPDYIVYEYTLGDTTTRLRVGDDRGEMHFLLEPMDPKAHAYLKQHLHGCKSRSQIAAVMQEALTLP